jgi:long-chain fatty acid transport protein
MREAARVAVVRYAVDSEGDAMIALARETAVDPGRFRPGIFIEKLRRTALAAALFGLSAPAQAAFFQIAENSASGIGNAFAGGAAAAEDASTVWYNPAGMTRLKGSQLAVGGHYIHPSFKGDVKSASTALGFAIGGGGGDAGEAAFVPNLYASFPVSSRLALGAGINAPFGLATNYEDAWAGRYHALRSDIKTVNLNLAGAFKMHDVLSVGMGVNRQRLNAELSQAVDFATLCTTALALGIANTCGASGGFIQPGSPNDGKGKVTAKGDAWGYNLGLLSQLGDTRLGLAYRSKMKYKLDGTFDITTPANVPGSLLTDSRFRLLDSNAESEVTLPSTLSLSAHQKLGSAWAVMADVTRTNWSVLPELRIKFDSGQADSVVTLNLKNVYRYSLGTTYQPSDSWVLRFGLALDRSPVTSASDRTPRLPDSDRRWLAVGAGLRASASLNFDLAYAYIKLKDNSVVKTAGGAGTENFSRGNLSVDYKGSVQIFSAQARWAF